MELNIAVVDDFESDCKRIEEYIEHYFSDHRNKPTRVGRYYNAEDFLKTYRKGEYQIIFLDVCMGDMNGLELANRIRSGDKDICIIFMSTTRDFVFQSFSAVPEGYLCKPYEYAAFAEVMERTLSKLFEEEKLLKIQLSHCEAEVSIGEIVAVLSNNHSVDLKMITGEILESNMLFSDIQGALENEPNFLECNRGIIINMDYATQIKGDTIIMQDGTGYPVRRRGRKEISAKFTKYIAVKLRRRLDI